LLAGVLLPHRHTLRHPLSESSQELPLISRCAAIFRIPRKILSIVAYLEGRNEPMNPLCLAPLSVLILCSSVYGDITYYKNNKAQWIADVGEFTTLGFNDLGPVPVIVTEQYSELGVHFTDGDDVAYKFGSAITDGWGMKDNPGGTIYIQLEFDKPQYWLGVDHPGGMACLLFNDEELIDEMHVFELSGDVNFAGVLSDVGLNKVRLRDVIDTVVAVDNIHFGAPPTCLLADLNCDGTVDGADLGLLLSAWGLEDDPADLNADGIVDGGDLGILLAGWMG
jgi:hypothetical protein